MAGGSRGGEGNFLLSGRETAGGDIATLLFEWKMSLSDFLESLPLYYREG